MNPLDMFKSLLQAGLTVPGFSASKERAPEIVIRIPRDHPKLEKMLRLVDFLSSSSQTEAGVVIERACPVSPQDAEGMLFDMLRELVDAPDELDRLRLQFEARSREARMRALLEQRLTGLLGRSS